MYVHDWILERTYDTEETEFKPNGEMTNSGIPIGVIKTIYSRFAVVKKVASYSGGVFGSGGGLTVNDLGNLVVSVAGGGTTTIYCLSQSATSPPPGIYQPEWSLWPTLPGGNARFGWLSNDVEGIADMVLGLYNFKGILVSRKYEYLYGAWEG